MVAGLKLVDQFLLPSNQSTQILKKASNNNLFQSLNDNYEIIINDLTNKKKIDDNNLTILTNNFTQQQQQLNENFNIENDLNNKIDLKENNNIENFKFVLIFFYII